jgi:hypothetical protein
VSMEGSPISPSISNLQPRCDLSSRHHSISYFPACPPAEDVEPNQQQHPPLRLCCSSIPAYMVSPNNPSSVYNCPQIVTALPIRSSLSCCSEPTQRRLHGAKCSHPCRTPRHNRRTSMLHDNLSSCCSSILSMPMLHCIGLPYGFPA